MQTEEESCLAQMCELQVQCFLFSRQSAHFLKLSIRETMLRVSKVYVLQGRPRPLAPVENGLPLCSTFGQAGLSWLSLGSWKRMDATLFMSLIKHLDAMHISPLILGILKQFGVSIFYTCLYSFWEHQWDLRNAHVCHMSFVLLSPRFIIKTILFGECIFVCVCVCVCMCMCVCV
jgi:hypothetical protein